MLKSAAQTVQVLALFYVRFDKRPCQNPTLIFREHVRRQRVPCWPDLGELIVGGGLCCLRCVNLNHSLHGLHPRIQGFLGGFCGCCWLSAHAAAALMDDSLSCCGGLRAVKRVRADVEGVSDVATQHEDHAQIGGDDDGIDGFFGAGGQGVNLVRAEARVERVAFENLPRLLRGLLLRRG